jgi:hypothetical protein
MSFKKFDYQTGFSGITFADIALFLKRTLTASEQTLVTSLIAEVEREICRSTSRQFSDTAEYYEEFRSGYSQFYLYNLPVASISLIEIDGVDMTSSYTEGSDYWILDEILIKFEVPIVSQNLYTGVKLTYTIRKFWGEDIELLIKKMVAVNFLRSEDGGVALGSFSFADEAQQFNQRQFDIEKEKVINYYKSLSV